jgi:hypothetical protein
MPHIRRGANKENRKMKKIMSLAAGAVLLAASSLGAAAPASAAMMGPMHHADPGREAAMVMRWCADHPRDPDCRDFEHHHHRWSDASYHGWYMRHSHDRGFDPGAALVFGFGAAIGGAIAHAH